MAQRFSLAAPPQSGKVSRREAVSRSGRASSIDSNGSSFGGFGSDATFSPSSAQMLAQQARQNAIAEEDNPFGPVPTKPAAAVDPFSAASASADLFSFFDPLAAVPVSQPRPAPAQKPAPQPKPAVEAFSSAFTSQLTFSNQPGAGAADPFDPFAAAVIPAGVAQAPAPASAPKAAAAAKAADSSSDDSDSSSSDSSDSDSSDSDSDSSDEEDARKKKKQAAIANKSHYATPAASNVASTGNRSLATPGAGAGSAAAGSAAAGAGSAASGTSALTVDVLELMHKGCPFLKYGKTGFPHFRQFQLSADNTRIEWFSGNKKPSETQIPLAVIDDIRIGQTTPNFIRHPAPDLEKSSFSVLYNMGKNTLDVIAKDPNDFLVWTRGLRELLRISNDRPGALEDLKSLPLSLGIHTARRSSVDIRDVNTGTTAAALAAEGQEAPRPRALATGNKGMMRDVHANLAKLKHKLAKRKDELREHHFYMSPQYPSMQAIIKRVQESVNKCDEFFQDGEYPECDDEIWRAGVDLESLKNMMKAVKKP